MQNKKNGYVSSIETAAKAQCIALFIFVFLAFIFPSDTRAESDEESVHHITIQSPESSDDFKLLLADWQELLASKTLPEDADSNYGHYRFEQDKVFLQKSLEAEGYYQGSVAGYCPAPL